MTPALPVATLRSQLSHVMVATGRTPNIWNLGLEEVGVKLNPRTKAVEVDEYSRTSVPSIWAVGDVTNRVNLTPVALMEGMALAATIAKDQPTKPDYEASRASRPRSLPSSRCLPAASSSSQYIASAVFTQPSMATVGMTEEAAAEKVHDVDVYTSSFRPMRNTMSGNPMRTFMKLVVDANTQRVIGCHMVGPDAAEIMQGMAVALKVGCTKQQLDSVVGIHPSAAEGEASQRSLFRCPRSCP